jgi:hypothetical protein
MADDEENGGAGGDSDAHDGPVSKEERLSWRLRRKAGARSIFWEHFRVYANGREPNKVVCILCEPRKELMASKSGSTNGLKRHLVSRHKKEYKSTLQGGHKHVSGSGSVSTKQGSGSVSTTKAANYEESRNRWIVLTHQPLSVVEDPCFRRMIAALGGPTVKVDVSRAEVMDQLVAAEQKERARLREELRDQTVSVTTDAWNGADYRSYISLSIHFINEEWELKRCELDAVPVQDTHTAEYIAGKLYEITRSSGIKDDNIIAMVTDTVAAMTTAGREHFKSEWHPSVDHALQLTINLISSKVKGMTNTLAVARSLVEYFKNSPTMANELQDMQRCMNRPERGVVQDMATCWWSTQAMCSRLLQIKVRETL